MTAGCFGETSNYTVYPLHLLRQVVETDNNVLGENISRSKSVNTLPMVPHFCSLLFRPGALAIREDIYLWDV